MVLANPTHEVGKLQHASIVVAVLATRPIMISKAAEYECKVWV
jgi:hypothetical protein